MDFERTQFDDDRLDDALKKYGAAEPRSGLESRILANLAAERESLAGRHSHWQLATATLAFGLAVAVGFFLTRRPDSPSVKVLNEAPTTKTSQGTRSPETSDHNTVVALRPTNHGKPQHQVTKSRREPRLEQFPSPSPLNEQEEMLARYVRERRQEAVMVARARAELLRADLSRFQQPQGAKEEDSER